MKNQGKSFNDKHGHIKSVNIHDRSFNNVKYGQMFKDPGKKEINKAKQM